MKSEILFVLVHYKGNIYQKIDSFNTYSIN